MREPPPGVSGSGKPSKHLDDTKPVTLYSSPNLDDHGSGYTVASRSNEEKELKDTVDSEIEQHKRLRGLIEFLLSKSTEDNLLTIKLSHEDSPKPGSLCNIHNAAPKTAASAVTQEFSFQSKDTKDIQSNPTVAVDTHWDNDKSCWQSMATPGNNATRKQQLQACAIALAQAHIAQVFESKQSGLSVSFTVQLGAHGDHVQLISDAIDDYFTAVASIEGFDRSFHATVNFDPSEHKAINKDYPNNTRSNHTKHSLFKGKENSLPSTLNDNSGASNDSFIETNNGSL